MKLRGTTFWRRQTTNLKKHGVFALAEAKSVARLSKICQNAGATFALAAGNTNPQGIADPPPPDMMFPLAAVTQTHTPAQIIRAESHAAISNRFQLDDPLWGLLPSRAATNVSDWLWPDKQGDRSRFEVP